MSNINTTDIIQDERIKEQSFGKYENTKLSEFIQAAIKAGGNFDEFCLETMEDNKSVKNRTKDFFNSLITKVVHFISSFVPITHKNCFDFLILIRHFDGTIAFRGCS